MTYDVIFDFRIVIKSGTVIDGLFYPQDTVRTYSDSISTGSPVPRNQARTWLLNEGSILLNLLIRDGYVL